MPEGRDCPRVLPEAEVLTNVYDTVTSGRVRDIARYIHPDCEFIDPPELPDGDRHVGREQVVSYLEEFASTWGVLEISIEEYHGSGGRVGAWVRIDLRGAASGAQAVMYVFHVVDFEDGLIRHVQGYFERADGLAALVGKAPHI